MVSKEAIDAALSAHAQWKKLLQDAVSTGQSEFKVAVVRTDTGCQFGKWLHGLTQDERNSADCGHVMELHAEFHRTAAEILDLGLKGKKEEAMKLLGFGGAYAGISGKLVLALHAWKKRIEQQ